MQAVDPLVVELIDSWSSIPAVVRSSTLDVLAANRLAGAVSPSFTVGVNLARFAFLDSFVQDGTARGADVSGHVVSFLRTLAQSHPETTELRNLVGELSAQSDEFSRTWADDLRVANYQTPVVMQHPRVGQLEIIFQQLLLAGEDGQVLVIAQVEPGSATEDRIFQLAAELEID